jgi:hypothetical protein
MRLALIALLLCGCASAGTIPLGGDAPALPGHTEMCQRHPYSELCPK